MISNLKKEILSLIDIKKEKKDAFTFNEVEEIIFLFTEKKRYIKKLLEDDKITTDDKLELNKILIAVTNFIEFMNNIILKMRTTSNLREELIFIIETFQEKKDTLLISEIEEVLSLFNGKKLYIKKLLEDDEITTINELELNKILTQITNFIEEMNDVMSLSKKANNKKIVIITVVIEIILISFIIFTSTFTNKNYYSKEKAQNIVIQAIKNEIPTKDIVSILKNKKDNKSFILFLKSKQEEIYEHPLSLETILIDIRNDNSINPKIDRNLNENINKMLREFRQISPFDKLNKDQIDNFTNIKNKLNNENYLKIENDILKIVDNLSSNTRLINVYLTKSDESYTMTIIALVLSIFSFIPLFIKVIPFSINKLKKIKNNKT